MQRVLVVLGNDIIRTAAIHMLCLCVRECGLNTELGESMLTDMS